MIGTYGHGTHNDFVLLFDPENQLEITPEQVKKICNRQTGIGSDGLIRIGKLDGKWFMDYRNADGSLAEMCGNGIRVMARYLVERGHQPEGIFGINSRAGMRYLAVPADDDISVNMGHAVLDDEYPEVAVTVNGKSWPALNINVGNPHAVVFVDDLAEAGELLVAPEVDPVEAYPEGVNVEFVQILANGELAMRVHERGVGETQSCGTGTCAVALAATLKLGKKLPSHWVINPPGGRLVVDTDGHNNATLIGPAVLLEDRDVSQYL
jgi:diaminopimelate epimerase